VGFTNFEPGAYNGYEVDQGGNLSPLRCPNWRGQLGLTDRRKHADLANA
jgi:hypothetical protein